MSRVRYTCPACGASVLGPRELAGHPGRCPKCQSNVSHWPAPVPPPPPPPAPPAPESPPASTPPPASEPEVIDYEEAECQEGEPYEEEPYYVPRRRRKGPPWIAIAIIAFVGILALGAVAATLVKAKKAHDAAKVKKKVDRAEPQRWDRNVAAVDREVARERELERERAGEWERESEREEAGRTLVTVLVLLLAVPLYFLPTIIALLRKHNNVAPIAVVNFLLGFVFVGWVVALAWALTDQAPSRRAGPI